MKKMGRWKWVAFLLILGWIGESHPEVQAASGELTDEDMFTERDSRTTYEEQDCIRIQLNGDSAEASSDSVLITGTTVQITEEASYLISGTLENGQIIVNAGDADKLQLIFDGVRICSETSAALFIQEADKVFVTLTDGTENTLENGGSFTDTEETNIDGAIFSRQDLTFNGTGSLTVLSPAGHGIVGKDDVVFTGGNYTIQAASHGIDANDSVRITGTANLTADAGKDGIHCENKEDASLGFVYISDGTLHMETQGDGISAGAYAQISGGDFTLLTGGGSENGPQHTSDFTGEFMEKRGGDEKTEEAEEEENTSRKGIKAAGNLNISGGTFEIHSADDSIHSNETITISGGTFQIASGDDAVHADEMLTVTDCEMEITESYEGLEALHVYVEGGNIRLTAEDDGLNAAGGKTLDDRNGVFDGTSDGTIVITGGNVTICASGDGIDANGTLEISGGYIVITGSTQGDTATLDYDKTAVITGGTFIGTGAYGMAQTFSSADQGVFSIRTGKQEAGTQITLKEKDGTVLLEQTPEQPFEIVILSSPDVTVGETYAVTVGEVTDQFVASAGADEKQAAVAEKTAGAEDMEDTEEAKEQIYNGTISACGDGTITIAAEDGEMTVEVTDSTIFSYFFDGSDDMGKMNQTQSAFVQMQGVEQQEAPEEMSQNQEAPEPPEGMPQDQEAPEPPDGMYQNGEVPEPPEGMPQDQEAPEPPEGMSQNGEVPEPPEGMAQNQEAPEFPGRKEERGNEKRTLTLEDLAVGDTVKVTVGENNKAISIMLQKSRKEMAELF